MPAVNDADDVLISKADALIRRHRADAQTGDDLPLLIEEIDDELPELTDAMDDDILLSEALDDLTLTDTIDLLNDAELPPMRGPAIQQIDLPTVRQAIAGLPRDVVMQQAPEGLSQEQVDILIDDAVQRARDDMQRAQERAIEEAVARARDAFAAEHAAMVEAVRAEASANARPSEEAIAAIHREARQAASEQMGERLIELDAYIAQAIDGWIARELPQIISGELDALVERLRIQTTAHMRATLLPEISDKLSGLL
ncbi:hypothetical protein ACDA63_15430 [Uliginosibacterium sp. sgz301328]|uniref:hypothetical protein n=1 Tax=Uliginosibacterium sp. sgz301328 TaxID=3243764 RepID=UPI00359D0411